MSNYILDLLIQNLDECPLTFFIRAITVPWCLKPERNLSKNHLHLNSFKQNQNSLKIPWKANFSYINSTLLNMFENVGLVSKQQLLHHPAVLSWMHWMLADQLNCSCAASAVLKTEMAEPQTTQSSHGPRHFHSLHLFSNIRLEANCVGGLINVSTSKKQDIRIVNIPLDDVRLSSSLWLCYL